MKFYSRYIVINILKFYQKIFSFDHGLPRFFYAFGFCRFRPTCSEYAIAAIAKYGLAKGGLKSLWRILRCNPFNKGGYDPVK